MSTKKYSTHNYNYFRYYDVGDKITLNKECQEETNCKNVIITSKKWDSKLKTYAYTFDDDKANLIWTIYDNHIEGLYKETVDDYDDSNLPQINEIV